jgi:signal transduction histidine kinase/CheY-like chemotaxis protein
MRPQLNLGRWTGPSRIRGIMKHRRAEQGTRLPRERLLALDAIQRLPRVSTGFLDEEGLQGVLDEILDAAIAITEADFGDIQVLNARSSELEIVAACGLPPWWIEYWGGAGKGQGSCGRALAQAERVVVEDVLDSPLFNTSDALDIQLRAGVRAVQSTPLVDRSGMLLGMISTHYTRPQRPPEGALRLLDLLARQATDILERARREVEERRHEIEQRVLADVGGALATLDYEHALTNASRRLTAESIADFVMMFLVGEDGRIRRAAGACRAAEHTASLETMLALQAQPRPAHPLWGVIGERRTLIRAIDPAEYERLAESPEHLRMMRTVNPRYMLFAPMLAGNSCVGAIGLVSSSRPFDDRDCRLVEEIGRRCALFVENRRLHEREQRAIRARGAVLGVVAHDLRSPLQSILLNARILRHQSADSESVEAIRHAATRMNRIIEDLLVVARCDAGMLEVEPKAMPATELVDEAARAHRSAIQARGLELRFAVASELPQVRADRERVARVFENLVGNAVKFTTSGAITIGARPSGGDVVFSVADTGVGIAAETLARIFDPFWQARPARRETAGLGLSIVKTIVEAHGGLTWARSEVGVGSTFYFTLPLASVSVAAPGDSATPAATPVVLIVEDDAALRRGLARVLRQRGYVTKTATNGQEALDYLRRGERPGVIVLDLTMPALDGWAFLDERNRDADFRLIPVIVISGQDEAARRVAAQNATFLVKPIAPDDLVATIQAATSLSAPV